MGRFPDVWQCHRVLRSTEALGQLNLRSRDVHIWKTVSRRINIPRHSSQQLKKRKLGNNKPQARSSMCGGWFPQSGFTSCLWRLQVVSTLGKLDNLSIIQFHHFWNENDNMECNKMRCRLLWGLNEFTYIFLKSSTQKCPMNIYICSEREREREAYFGNITSLVVDHCNKVSISKKQVKWIFWFPSTYENYLYICLYIL